MVGHLMRRNLCLSGPVSLHHSTQCWKRPYSVVVYSVSLHSKPRCPLARCSTVLVLLVLTGAFGTGFTTKLSSAGLVYKHYGKEIIAGILSLPVDHPSVTKACVLARRDFWRGNGAATGRTDMQC